MSNRTVAFSASANPSNRLAHRNSTSMNNSINGNTQNSNNGTNATSSKVSAVSNSKNASDHKISVARDLETLLFATPDPNNSAYFKNTSTSSSSQQKTIHVFPPSETLQQRAALESQKQALKVKKIATGQVFRQQPSTSANLVSNNNNTITPTTTTTTSEAAFQSEKSFLATIPKTENYNAALSPNASLQLVVDAANDGDCVYIQPGTHDLKEPLFISAKKKIFIIGFVESHTESAPPTLRMKVKLEDVNKKKSLFAAYTNKNVNPVRPMIRVQQGAEVFLSHMRFEYVIEFPDDDKDDRGEVLNSSNNTSKIEGEEKSDGDRNISNIQDGGFGNAQQQAHVFSKNVDGSIQVTSADDPFSPQQQLSREEATLRENADRLSRTTNNNNKKLQQKTDYEIQQEKEQKKMELEANRIRKLRDVAGTLPIKANILEIAGAGTQVTLNHCIFLSEGHGIHFRCTATSVSASSTHVSSPRLSIRDQCYFECPFGTGLFAIAEEESGFASHTGARLNPMSPPRDTIKHPEGIINIARSSFSLCHCGAEFAGPLHIKIADCDFDSCDIGLNATVCMPMQLAVSETLFAKCSQFGVTIDAPPGSGSSRDVEFSDVRFDLCNRGVVLQGADCAASFDTCVATRCTSCGFLVDGGRATITNSIIQQNDIGVEILDGKPVFTNTTFHGNSGAGVVVSGKGTTPTLRENTFTNTGESGPSLNGTRLNALSRLDAEDEANAAACGRQCLDEFYQNRRSNVNNNNNNSASLTNSYHSNYGRNTNDDDDDQQETDESREQGRNRNFALALKSNDTQLEHGSGISKKSASLANTSLRSHRRAVRCAAIFVEQDATPLVEYNRFEGNSGANTLIVGGMGVFTDNAFGPPAADSYGIVVCGVRSCPRIEHNVVSGNERGQPRPTVVIEDGGSAVVQMNDFAAGNSSAVVLRRSGPQTAVLQNRVSEKFMEGIVVMERSEGVAMRNSMGKLTVEVFSDSQQTFNNA